jgi:tetratricopeptide (TPR) repeat protein
MNLSVLAWKTDDLRASLAAAEDAVRCNPRLALAHHYRGAALERLGRTDDALRAYRQTTALDGQQVEAWFAEGNLLAQRGDWVGAVAAYDQGLAVDPARPEMAMAAGLIFHHRLADTRRALVRYEQVLQAAPAHYGARYQRAVALLAAGEDARAVEAWRAFVPLAVAAGDDAALDGAPERLRRAAPPRPAGTRPST